MARRRGIEGKGNGEGRVVKVIFLQNALKSNDPKSFLGTFKILSTIGILLKIRAHKLISQY